jgi:hypothetical protein
MRLARASALHAAAPGGCTFGRYPGEGAELDLGGTAALLAQFVVKGWADLVVVAKLLDREQCAAAGTGLLGEFRHGDRAPKSGRLYP